MSSDELADVIEDSLNDAGLEETTPETPDEPITEVATEGRVEIAAPRTQGFEETSEETVETKESEETSRVEAPGEREEDDAPADVFSKKFGVSEKGVTGRENRIPYSRVKKIVEKNEKDTELRVARAIEERYQPHFTQFQETETRVKDYEERLTKVAQFEHIMEHEPKQMLDILSQLPAYKQFFQYLGKLSPPKAGGQAGAGQAGAGGAKRQSAPPINPSDTRPLPNKTLADGSQVYDLEGLDGLMDWQSRQVEARVSKQVEEKMGRRYAGIEHEWNQNQYMAQVLPGIDRQIAEANTWAQFTENEPEITAALVADKSLTLEGAYRQIVLPKLVSDKNRMRSEVLAEIRSKPKTLAAPVTRTKARQAASNENRDLTSIIRDEVDKIR